MKNKVGKIAVPQSHISSKDYYSDLSECKIYE